MKMMILILSKIQEMTQQRKNMKNLRKKSTMTSKMKLREILTRTRMSISLPLTKPG